jgi:signal transduction histidine kinase
MLDERKHDLESTREILESLGHQANSNVAIYDAQGSMVLHVGRHAPRLTPRQIADSNWLITRDGPTFNRRLADGRRLVVHPRHRILAYGLHTGLLLTTIAALLALLTYPLTRGITARLGRLQTGVQQFGSGNLAARVKVEGRDEVAALAKSFNESAEHIEKLVRAHHLLLANCSHELRTPLARIRLGVERVAGTDSKTSAEIARSIAELDALIGEMLLSSRLDASSGVQRTEPVDLLALRTVTMDEFERAKDKIMMGAERRSMVMDEQEKKLTAYHEAGHAIVGLTVPEHDPVYKVTIIPRGRALGVTMFLPETDRYSISKRRLESKIATLFGGRIAEELVFGVESVTTGASNDIERATEIARNMVTKWGLSDKLGPLTYSEDQGEVFLGRSVTQHKQVSDVTAHVIDEEVRRLIDSNYQRAKGILDSNLEKLHKMAEALMKYETIDESQLKDIMQGREPKPPADWDDSPTSPSGGAKARDRDKPEAPIGKPASQH